MKKVLGAHDAVHWYAAFPHTENSPLAHDESADVVVVGGGMAGLMCAQVLRRAGKSVIVLEKTFCGGGASGKSSGFITPDSELELSNLLGKYGKDRARNIWEFVTSGVEAIRENILAHNIDCDYQVQDSLFIANNAATLDRVEEEHEARLALGYNSTRYDKGGLGAVIGSKKYAGAVRYPDTYGMNGFRYCQGLKKVLEAEGVKIFENTTVQKISRGKVVCENGAVTAQHVVVCADRFVPDLGKLKLEIYHAQTFLMVSKPLSPEVVKKIFPGDKLMVWDTDPIYQYYRITGDNRLLLGGGDVLYTYAGREKHNPQRFYTKLTRYLKERYPDLDIEIEAIWPGMIGVSKDLLPIVGEDAREPGIFYVSAASGLPWAAALGRYIAEKITTGRSDFDHDFRPNRPFPISNKIQRIISTQPSYAFSHALVKKFRVRELYTLLLDLKLPFL